MDHKTILKDLKAGNYHPVYFLQSEEAYYIDIIVNYIEKKILDEAAQAFNQVVVYGKEVDFKQIIDQALQYPMMASHRVVIVKEAQELSTIEKLADYIEKPSPQTILVIAHKHKKLDKRKKKIWTALKKTAVVLETKKIYDNQVPGLISNLAKEKKIKVNARVANLIAEHLGTDLSKINNELDKLALNLDDGTEVTMAHVEKYVGISKDYNVFELQKAIGMRDVQKAYKIVLHFSRNSKSNPIQMNIGALYNYFSKLFIAKKYQNADSKSFASAVKVNPFFANEYKAAAKNYTVPQIKQAFKLVHVMDKQCKGVERKSGNELGIYQQFLHSLFR